MTRIDTHRTAPASHGARFSASDRPLPPVWRDRSVPTTGSPDAARARLARRARLAALMIALATIGAAAIAAPLELLALLMVVAITVVIVGGAFLIVERGNRPRDGARSPSYFAPDHLTRRGAC